MRIFRLIKHAGGALAGRGGKTFLMMIGTAIGIMLLTAVVGLSQGVQNKIEEITNFLGPRAIMVFSGGGRMRGMGGRGASISTMKPQDAEALRAQLGDKTYVTGGYFSSNTPIKARAQNSQTSVICADPDFPITFDWYVESGDPISWDDERSIRRVCVLGSSTAKNLFPGESPIDQRIAINRVMFRVVGILSSRGTDPRGRDLDDRIWIPLSTGMKRVFHKDSLRFVRLNVRNSKDIPAVIDRVKTILKARHKIVPPMEDDFRILTPDFIGDRIREMTRTTRLVGAALAIIALIVGGVVLMNIMLLSLSERIPEIGLKRALGARQADIFTEFLAEAVLVSLLGMVLGVLLGLLPVFIIPKYVPMIPMAISWKTFVYAALFAMGVGLVFGVQPARRAARMDPVEALREN